MAAETDLKLYNGRRRHFSANSRYWEWRQWTWRDRKWPSTTFTMFQMTDQNLGLSISHSQRSGFDSLANIDKMLHQAQHSKAVFVNCMLL